MIVSAPTDGLAFGGGSDEVVQDRGARVLRSGRDRDGHTIALLANPFKRSIRCLRRRRGACEARAGERGRIAVGVARAREHQKDGEVVGPHRNVPRSPRFGKKIGGATDTPQASAGGPKVLPQIKPCGSPPAANVTFIHSSVTRRSAQPA